MVTGRYRPGTAQLARTARAAATAASSRPNTARRPSASLTAVTQNRSAGHRPGCSSASRRSKASVVARPAGISPTPAWTGRARQGGHSAFRASCGDCGHRRRSAVPSR